MRWSDLPLNPSRRMLRQFSAACIVVLGGMALWQGLVQHRAGWAWALGGLALGVGILGLAAPRAVRPVGTRIGTVRFAACTFGRRRPGPGGGGAPAGPTAGFGLATGSTLRGGGAAARAGSTEGPSGGGATGGGETGTGVAGWEGVASGSDSDSNPAAASSAGTAGCSTTSRAGAASTGVSGATAGRVFSGASISTSASA